MAIVQMKKLSLAVLRSQKEALLKELVRHGCVEVSEIGADVLESEAAGFLHGESSELLRFKQAYSSVLQGISVLDKYVPQKKGLLSAGRSAEKSAFLDDTGMWGSVECAERILINEENTKKITAEESRLKGLLESLQPWIPLNMPLNSAGTEYAAVMLGTVPIKVSPGEISAALETVTEEAELYPISEDKAFRYLMIVCLREKLPDVQEMMRSFAFTASALTGMEGSAREISGKTELTLRELAEEKTRCGNEIRSESVRREELEISADKLSTRISMAEAEEKFFGTESAVYMRGWVPAEEEKALEILFGDFDCAYELKDPEPEEYPGVPVSLKNNRITDGLNMVTNMYSLPAYGSVDPNPLMAPFFILFFGLMMADMGYGILMVIAAIVALTKIKPEGGTLSFCRLLLWGGIATLAMGALTGSLFSDAPKQLYDLICESKGMEPVWQGLPKLFSPTDDSITVLVGALILGWLHLNTGMVVSFVQKWKNGDKSGAIWEEGALWCLLIGGAVFALKKLGVVPAIPDAVAVGALIAGAAVLLFGAGRNAKGFGKVTAAFGCVYNTATGWFGDILSYSRIMALMLAGGVIGQVFNTVAVMPAKSSGINPLTIAAFVVIFLAGHAMNFGLNLLGCFVHDLRLQCLEFFGKFYQDGGKPFRPLKISGKYVKAK